MLERGGDVPVVQPECSRAVHTHEAITFRSDPCYSPLAAGVARPRAVRRSECRSVGRRRAVTAMADNAEPRAGVMTMAFSALIAVTVGQAWRRKSTRRATRSPEGTPEDLEDSFSGATASRRPSQAAGTGPCPSRLRRMRSAATKAIAMGRRPGCPRRSSTRLSSRRCTCSHG